MTHLILLIVALQHLGYMALSRRNSARLLARGGEEVGRRDLPLFVAVYVAWFVAMAVFIDPGTPVRASGGSGSIWCCRRSGPGSC